MRKTRSLRPGVIGFTPARLLLAVVVAGLCVLVWRQYPITAEQAGLDFWNANRLTKEIAREECNRCELEQHGEAVRKRMDLRGQILANLLEEKITLQEAGQGFLDLNRLEPCVMTYLRISHPEGTDLERSCTQVVQHMRNSGLPGSVERYHELRCELETIVPRGSTAHVSWR